MVNIDISIEINKQLAILYKEHTQVFINEWEKAFCAKQPPRINEFGIIDEQRYDIDKGILFVCKETNGWDDGDYESGTLFRTWMQDITLNGLENRGHIKRHPNMWYNIGRWAMLLNHPTYGIQEVASQKQEALTEIGTIAFTNINKVKGDSSSKKKYYELVYSDIVGEVLKREIKIIKPNMIVCCGTHNEFFHHITDYEGKVICMTHPAARKNKIVLLEELKKQMEEKE